MSTDKKISKLIKTQVPDFVLEDHPNLVLFLEAYYEWMEECGNSVERIHNLRDFRDIDKTLPEFIDYFKNTFLANLPANCLADKRKILKHIKQFYRARGSEKAFRFLFNILFESPVEFDFPGRRMLRPSDGKWIQDNTIKVKQIVAFGDPADFVGKKIKGRDSGASATVEKIQIRQVGINTVHELFLNRSTLQGDFDIGERIFADGITTEAEVFGVVTDIDILSPGQFYSVGQLIEFTGVGFGAKGRITAIDTTAGDQIVSVEVFETGAGYDPDFPPTVVFPLGFPTAVGEAVLGTRTTYPGFFLNEDGFLDDARYLQDSFFYQQFSYVIFVNQSIEQYKQIVLDILHPSGLLMFGGVLFVDELEVGASLPFLDGRCSELELEIGWHSPAVPAIVDLPEGVNCGTVELEIYSQECPDQYHLGPSLRHLEMGKFFYLPSEIRPLSDTEDFPAPSTNSGYWTVYGNTQIKDFRHLVIEDFLVKPWTRLNIMPAPTLKNEV